MSEKVLGFREKDLVRAGEDDNYYWQAFSEGIPVVSLEWHNSVIRNLKQKNERTNNKLVAKILILRRELKQLQASNLGMKTELAAKRREK